MTPKMNGSWPGSHDDDGVRPGGEREGLVVAAKLLDTAGERAVNVDLRAPRLDIELDAAGRRPFAERRLRERDGLGQRDDRPRATRSAEDWSVGEAGRGSTDGAGGRDVSLPRNCASAVAAVDTTQ